jgi:gas vesicle protein
MDTYTQERRDYGFVIGLLTGTVVGAGAAMWLAPRVASRLRQQRDDVADAVVRGAQEVERFATASKSDSVDASRGGQ